MEKKFLEEKTFNGNKEIENSLLNKGKVISIGVTSAVGGAFIGSRLGLYLSELSSLEETYPLWDFAQTMQNITYSMVGGGIGALTFFTALNYCNLTSQK